MQMDAVSLLSGEQGETTKAQRYPLIICDSLHAAWMNMAHVWMNYIYIYTCLTTCLLSLYQNHV